MFKKEILYEKSLSKRALPVNLEQSDLKFFKHELSREIPATELLHLKNITVNSDGILFYRGKILPESFASPDYILPQTNHKTRLKSFIKNRLLGNYEKINSETIWITDDWSKGYFHWMTDALPRLLAVRQKLNGATLLLPGAYRNEKFVIPSLKPLFDGDIEFVDKNTRCKTLYLPMQTAPTGNYNENIINGLRSIFTDYGKEIKSDLESERIYISRRKARWSKIVNEEEVYKVLKEYNFKVLYFEDYLFEQQLKIALEAKFLISNHGASLTNMLFMKPKGSVFELRRKDDSHNNCYFALASALGLKYFYQICDTENLDQRANTTDLIVNCQSLRENIERMTGVTSA